MEKAWHWLVERAAVSLVMAATTTAWLQVLADLFSDVAYVPWFFGALFLYVLWPLMTLLEVSMELLSEHS